MKSSQKPWIFVAVAGVVTLGTALVQNAAVAVVVLMLLRLLGGNL